MARAPMSRDSDDRPPRTLSADEIDDQFWKAMADLQSSVDRLQERTLDEKDVTAIRDLLEADRRTRWLWSSARAWAVWIAAVVAGYTVGLEALKSILKRLVA